jgi:hypothetical protein
LFNGGALTPAIVRDRIVEVITSWFLDEQGQAYSPRVLTNISLDLAVAQGAAYYGVVRRGGGIRIGGGTARSFYVGIETVRSQQPWLCAVPRDAQEGEEFAIAGHDFDLLMGRPVVFPLASSSVRPDDEPGDLLSADPDSIRQLPPLHGVMRVSRKARAERVPVNLAARVTEVGTIELWCQSRTDERRWRLQIQLRGPSGQLEGTGPVTGDDSDRVIIEQSVIDAATTVIQAAFEDGAGAAPPTAPTTGSSGPARLVKRLEEVIEAPRDQWPPTAIRSLWDPLLALAEKRLKSAQHESRWFNLAGFFLRPGRGCALDELRIKALWPIFHQGIKHAKDVQCWTEWWILWRRVAAGLSRPHHDEIQRRLAPFLVPAKGTSPAKRVGRSKPEPHEVAEMWRCAASLERLPAQIKESLGDALFNESSRASSGTHVLWSLGRLGARVPLYGPANTVVGRETAERWTKALLGRSFAPGRETSDAIFALVQLARVADDRTRDLDDPLRQVVLRRLVELGADELVLRPVREYHELETAQQAQALGDSLPIGLRLLSDTTS